MDCRLWLTSCPIKTLVSEVLHLNLHLRLVHLAGCFINLLLSVNCNVMSLTSDTNDFLWRQKEVHRGFEESNLMHEFNQTSFLS